MPPRPSLPADDLYARLEVSVDASFETIEVAWRALLKRHHPDVAGVDGLEVAKRINVAHDWLSDPDLRARYDRERYPHAHRRSAARRAPVHPAAAPDRPVRPAPGPVTLDEALRRFVDRAGRLTRDELDRLSVAESPPIAFVASIRRFLSPDRLQAIAAAERRLRAELPPEAWANLPLRDAVLAAAHEIVLGGFLDQHLEEPYRERARDRLTRSWEAALDQPRYGPNTAAVERLLARAARLTDAEGTVLVRAFGGGRIVEPWPRGIDPTEDEVFRVSSALAARDAAAAPDFGSLDRAVAGRARRIVALTAHGVVLRHAFGAAEFAELMTPWRTATGDPGTGRGARGIPDPVVHRRT